MMTPPSPSRPFIGILPLAIVKAKASPDGRRLVELCASTEVADLEGDCILQKALMDAAPSFVANGHLDIDHVSELYEDFGIANPTSWIVGRPLKVWDGGGGQTMVLCHLRKSESYDPLVNKWDELWASLQTDPPVAWRASVYGFIDPHSTVDCREEPCLWKGEGPAPTRYVVSKFDWRSLAFTRNPVCDGIKSYARIVSAKSWVGLVKAAKPDFSPAYRDAVSQVGGPVGTVLARDPMEDARRREEAGKLYEEFQRRVGEDSPVARQVTPEDEKAAGLLGAHRPEPHPTMSVIDGEIAGGGCPTCGGLVDAPSTALWKRHLTKCLGWNPTAAELGSNAAMYRLLLGHGWGRRRSQKRQPEAPELTPEMSGPVVYGPGNQSLAPDWHRPAHMANTRP